MQGSPTQDLLTRQPTKKHWRITPENFKLACKIDMTLYFIATIALVVGKKIYRPENFNGNETNAYCTNAACEGPLRTPMLAAVYLYALINVVQLTSMARLDGVIFHMPHPEAENCRLSSGQRLGYVIASLTAMTVLLGSALAITDLAVDLCTLAPATLLGFAFLELQRDAHRSNYPFDSIRPSGDDDEEEQRPNNLRATFASGK